MVKKSVLSLALAFIGLLLIVQGANALYAPTIPSSCSSANVSALWDSAFKGVSSSGIVIVNGTSGIKCDEFIAYKINGNLTNVLAGYDTPPYANRTRFYSAFEGNLSSAFQDILRNATNDNLIALNLSLSPSNVAIYTINYGINSIAEANTSFYSIFKAENSSWTSSGSGQNLVYSFSVNESNSSSITSVNGGVYNYSFNYLTFNKTVALIHSCAPNWVVVNTSCNSSEYKIMWYNDTSNCSNSTGMPANVTFSCDYDGNGLIGSFNSFSESNIDLDIYINGILGNNSMNYTGTKKIDFKENGVLRLTFNYSFDNPLDLRGVSIGIQDVDSSYGYIIVRGINITKSVWVDKINLSSNKVCIKNSDGNISSLTENCTATNEHLVDCPGSDGNLKCSINGSYFVVSGLTRSIVMEWLKDVEDVTCQTNWSCTLWSSCSNGNMSRICTDKSYCNVTVDKPAIIQSCSVSVCNVNWNCSNWGPEKCPSSLTQTRTCKDLSFCNVSSGKPPISRTCEMEKKSWTPIIVIAIVILLLIIVVIVMIMKFKGKKDDSSYVNIQNMPRSPPGSPISPRAYAPIVARPSPAVIQPKPMSLPQPKPLMPGTPFRQY